MKHRLQQNETPQQAGKEHRSSRFFDSRMLPGTTTTTTTPKLAFRLRSGVTLHPTASRPVEMPV
jgi:hypothetical protein